MTEPTWTAWAALLQQRDELRAEIERWKLTIALREAEIERLTMLHENSKHWEAEHLAEIDRHDGIIECTPQNVGALVNEVRRLRSEGCAPGQCRYGREILAAKDAEITRLRALLVSLVNDDWDIDAIPQPLWERIKAELEPKP